MAVEFKKQTGEVTVDTEDVKLDNASQFSFMSRSRIKKAFKKQTKKSIALFVGGILLLTVIVAFFGIPLLINYTVLLDNTNEVKSASNSVVDNYVPAPSLSSEFEATNSATVQIEGTSDTEYVIKLYNGEKKIDDIEVGNNGKFKADVKLRKGENILTAFAVSKNKKQSDPSEELSITYLPEPPKLEISSPSENQEYKGDRKFAEVKGTTSEGSKVTVNGFWAVMAGNGSFSYNLPLKDGDNAVNITSLDQAGNKTEKNFIVKYSQ